MEVERVMVAVDVQHLVGQKSSYGCAVESVVRRILSITGSSNTMWAFTFFDSSSASGWTSVLERAGAAPFASVDERSIRSFKSNVDKLLRHDGVAAAPRVVYIANALLPLLTSHLWNPLLLDVSQNARMVPPPLVTRRNLLLLLSYVPPPQELRRFVSASSSKADPDEDRIASLRNLLDRNDVRGFWLQPPCGEGTTSFQDTLHAVKGDGNEHRSASRWGFSSVDTFLLATLVIPHPLLLPMVLLPPGGTGRVAVQSPRAKLRLTIDGHLHFACCVRLTWLAGSVCLDACSKLRLDLRAVRRRTDFCPHQELSTYLVYQHPDRWSEKQDLGNTREELLRRLDPEHACHFHQLSHILLYLAQEAAVAIVELEVTHGETKMQLQGILEPLTILSATLHILGERQQLDVMTDSAVPKVPTVKTRPRTLLPSNNWDDAWNFCLKLVQNPGTDWMEPIFRKSMYSSVPRAWVEYVDKQWHAQQSTLRQDDEVPLAAVDLQETDSAAEVLQVRVNGVLPDTASSYISSLRDKVSKCITSGNFEAGKLVRDTLSALTASGASPTDSPVTEKLKTLLLQSPAELSSRYKEGTHARDHKINQYTLQIQLRLEMLLAADQAPGIDNAEFIEQICDLLYDIEFSLAGDAFDMEGGSLLSFADRVIRSSFEKPLPNIVNQIYTRMEFCGYNNNEESAEGLLLAAASVATGNEERHSFPVATVSDEESEKSSTKKPKLEMERARRLSHFSGRRQKLRFVRQARAPACRNVDTTESIAETPQFQMRASKSSTFRSDECFSVPSRRSIL